MAAQAAPASDGRDERDDEQQRERRAAGRYEARRRRRDGAEVDLSLRADIPEPGAKRERDPQRRQQARQRLHDRRC